MMSIVRAFVGLLTVATSVTFVYLWLFSEQPWLSSELLPISEFVHQKSSVVEQLRTVFNWRHFETVSARMRCWSDLCEVIDAMARPSLARLFGEHPSASLTALVGASLTITFCFASLRRLGCDRWSAFVLVSVLISTPGFLSCHIAYIRPGKRLALLAFWGTTWLALRFRDLPSWPAFIALSLVQLASMFADEAAFVQIAVILLLLTSMLKSPREWRLAVGGLAVVVVGYFLLAQVVIVRFYKLVGDHGSRRGAANDEVVGKLLSRFVDPRYWEIAAYDFSTSLGMTFGRPWLPWLVGALSCGVAVRCWRSAPADAERRRFDLAATAVALAITSAFVTLIDGYNSMAVPNEWGASTYYYHSTVPCAAVLFLAAVTAACPARKTVSSSFAGRLFLVTTLAAAVISANFANFIRINEFAKSVHVHELDFASLRHAARARLNNPTLEKLVVQRDREQMQRSIVQLGGTLNRTFAEREIERFQTHPMANRNYARRYIRLFDPQADIDVELTGASDLENVPRPATVPR